MLLQDLLFSNIFFEHIYALQLGQSWKTEIFRPEDLRQGRFSICQLKIPLQKLLFLFSRTFGPYNISVLLGRELHGSLIPRS